MRGRLLYTIVGTAVLSIALVLLLAGGGAAQTDPPASGDWTVSDTTVVSDRTVDLHGDLTVTSTGSLTLRNVTLTIFLGGNGDNGIEVQGGGSLVIEDNDHDGSTTGDASIVDSQPTSRSYFFIVRQDASLRISYSFVHRCGYTGTTGNERLGLFVGTDDANIEGTVIDDCLHGLVLDGATITVSDSTVSNCTYHGVNAQDSDVTLTRVTMADNGYEGARIVRGNALIDGCWVGGNRNGLQIRTGANVTVNNTVVRGNNDGMRVEIDGNVQVIGSTFRGQGQYGIRAENRGTLTITDSQLYGATRSALSIFNDVTVISSGSLYRSNVYGARFNMNCIFRSTGDTFSANTNTGIYMESTSDLVIVEGTVRGNSAGIKAEDSSTITAWGTTVEECSFEGYSVDQSTLEVHDGQILNCTGGGIVVITGATARWTVHTGNTSRLLDSDVYLSSSLVISGHTVLHDSIIVFPDYGYPSYVGLDVSDGTHDWQNTTFRPTTASGAITFDVHGTATGSAWHVTVQDTGANNMPADSPIVNADFDFHMCTFRDSTNGLMVHSGQVLLDRCTFTGNLNGASVSGAEVRFENCTFSSNTGTDLTPINNGHAVLVNCSFTPSKVVPVGPGDSWSAWWIVHVKVRFPAGGAAAGALLTVTDAKAGTVYSGTADGNGFIGGILLLEHMTAGTVRDSRTPHTFNASLGLSSNQVDLNVTGHMIITIEIADGSPPELVVTSHSDGDHVSDATLTLAGTAHDAGSSVYRVEARIATQAWQTCSGTTDWSWTTSLPGDGTYPISVRARDVALNEIVVFLNITLDTLPPVIDISVPPSPSNNSLTGSETVTLVGWVDAADVVVTAMGVTADMSGTSFSLNLTLADGLNKIAIRAEDPAGNVAILEWWLQADLDAPDLIILNPQNNSRHNSTTVTLTGTTDPYVDVYYRVSQISTVWSILTVSSSGGFTKEITDLKQGNNTLEVMVRDAADNEVVTVLELYVDTIPPTLVSSVPRNGVNLNHPQVLLRGQFDEPLSALTMDDLPATIENANFSISLDLEVGLNQYSMAAFDELGNVVLITFRIYLDMTPPSINFHDLTFDVETGDYLPFDTNHKQFLLLGTTEPGATVYIDMWEQIVDSQGVFGHDVTLDEGENLLPVLVRDAAGNEFHTNVTLVLDTYAPQLTVRTPEHMSTTSKDYVWVEGTVSEGDSVAVGDVEMVSEDGTFRLKVALDQAVNRIVVVAFDQAGNEVSVERLVFQNDDTDGLTGMSVLDDNCNAIMVVMVIVVIAIAVLLGYSWKGDDVMDRKERELESVLEEDHIELDKPHLEPSSGYLQYDPTSPTGRKNEFEERDDEEFISMDAFRREMERRE